ncbi:serine hydrolase, partial [Desulfovibrio desulfuricans]
MAELNQLIESRYRNIACMNIMKNGKLVYEKYFNGCTSQSTLHVYSVTKSIVSILIGIAMDQGYIKDVNQRVLDF